MNIFKRCLFLEIWHVVVAIPAVNSSIFRNLSIQVLLDDVPEMFSRPCVRLKFIGDPKAEISLNSIKNNVGSVDLSWSIFPHNIFFRIELLNSSSYIK